MKNWKTTLGGFLLAAGSAMYTSHNPYVSTTGNVLQILGSLILGAAAKDKNVTGGSTPQ